LEKLIFYFGKNKRAVFSTDKLEKLIFYFGKNKRAVFSTDKLEKLILKKKDIFIIII
jgi:hypothetical protein